jgi:hypothetical protein
LFFAQASFDSDGYSEVMQSALRQPNVEVVPAHKQHDPARELEQADAIFVGGGKLLRIDSRRISVPDADRMVTELVSAVASLPARAHAATGAAFDRPLTGTAEFDLIAYLVIRDAIRGHGPHDLTAAMERILQRPHERLSYEVADRPIWALDRLDGSTLVDIAARPIERIPVPSGSRLASTPITTRLHGALPARVRIRRARPTTETQENRFVATVLDRCLATVRAVAAHARRENAASMRPLEEEAAKLGSTIERWRQHRVLDDLQPSARLPASSTVLRGRPGYRDVLRLYADIIGQPRIVPPAALWRIVGQRNIATLYEWWCLFQLIDAVSATLGPTVRIVPPSVSWQGAELGQGLVAEFDADVAIEFNRGFSKSSLGRYHSYSVPLRPDLLLATPTGRHLFDAKFAFQAADTTLEDDQDEEGERPTGQARRWHIHKMHTYRDALDQVSSVRVLYPGSIEEWYPVDPAEPRHGVGAMPLRVAHTEDKAVLRGLTEVLIHPEQPRSAS